MDTPAQIETVLPTQSSSIGKITDALCKALPDIPEIKKEKTARVRSKKGEESSYTYKYADLSDILAAVIPVLAKHGMMLRWPCTPVEGGTKMTCILSHVSGEWVSSTLTLPAYTDDQSRGSGLSYNKRYLLGTLLPVAATEADDDGQRAAQDAAEKDETAAILERKRKEREELQKTDSFKKRCKPVEATTAVPSGDNEKELAAAGLAPTQAEPETKPEDKTPIDDVPPHLVKLQHALEKEGITVAKFMEYVTSPRPKQNKGAIRVKGFEFGSIDATLCATLLKTENWNWIVKFAKEGVK